MVRLSSSILHRSLPSAAENFRQVTERVIDRLADEGPEFEEVPLNFHLTSVYDHSLHNGFSRVLQKLIDSLSYLEGLLNVFCLVRRFLPSYGNSDLIHRQNTSCPKAFLFDIRSKLYVATDASPVDQATHNLCCDYLQMLNSFGPLYKYVGTDFLDTSADDVGVNQI